MTLTLLIDLDDTLLVNCMETFIPAYLNALGEQLADHNPPEKTARTLMSATRRMFANTNPSQTLEQGFDPHFYPPLGVEKAQIQGKIDAFYAEIFPSLKSLTQPLPQAVGFIEAAFGRGYRLGVATNPLFPRTAILQRLDWAGLSPEKYPFELIPSYEDFHFAKPNPAYFAEFLGRMGWPEGGLLAIGDDPDLDVRGAKGLGLPVFWISGGRGEFPKGMPSPDQSGALEDVLPWLDSLPPDSLQPDFSSTSATTATLRGCAAALKSMAAAFPLHLWNECPEPDEWCLTAVFCHLRDVEREVYLPRLQAITAQDNPFIVGIDTDAWADERMYKDQKGSAALEDFIQARLETLERLDRLSEDDWKRPARHAIFGPTDLKELAGIMAGHDRLHTRQVYETIETIWENIKRVGRQTIPVLLD